MLNKRDSGHLRWPILGPLLVFFVGPSWLHPVEIILGISKDLWWWIFKKKGLSSYTPFISSEEARRIDSGSDTRTPRSIRTNHGAKIMTTNVISKLSGRPAGGERESVRQSHRDRSRNRRMRLINMLKMEPIRAHFFSLESNPRLQAPSSSVHRRKKLIKHDDR